MLNVSCEVVVVVVLFSFMNKMIQRGLFILKRQSRGLEGLGVGVVKLVFSRLRAFGEGSVLGSVMIIKKFLLVHFLLFVFVDYESFLWVVLKPF